MHIIFIYIHKHNIHYYICLKSAAMSTTPLSMAVNRVLGRVAIYMRIREFCRTCRVQFVALPAHRRVQPVPWEGGVCGHVNSRKGFGSVCTHYTHTHKHINTHTNIQTHTHIFTIYIYMCSVCLASGERVRPSVCRINIIKGNFQSAAVTRRAHASPTPPPPLSFLHPDDDAAAAARRRISRIIILLLLIYASVHIADVRIVYIIPHGRRTHIRHHRRRRRNGRRRCRCLRRLVACRRVPL